MFFKRFLLYLPVLFAHKPLCVRFKKDVFKFGKIYFCRSCFFLYLGLCLCLLVNIFFKYLFYLSAYSFFFILMCFIVVFLSYPPLYKRLNRIIKDFLRFSLGGIVGNLMTLLFYGEYVYFALFCLVFWLIKHFYSAVRAGMKLNACDGCPELYRKGICSGYSPKVACMKKYEDFLENRIFAKRRRQVSSDF
ncbi:MAG: hypothetical protein PHP69_03760 [Candidatus Omnitrophica bacterium]|nr:hypothetical protein [Candidatus Omnitrophota bacterium]MDD5080572.1 hypothetical protein [Candidatus Omnitrophota bacterium]MDD5441077.1 hypothetical protein [Candidatus Omnitrophota bacterium]